MSITLEQVTKRYQGQPVVNDVSLTVAEGEFFVLLGPSGSGKSTLLRAIAGLVDIDDGTIALHGSDVTHVGARQRGVGFVFQHYALFRHLTIADNIEFALRVRRMKAADRRERRKELLKLVALEGMDERLPAQLSGGQQQRVAVARALAHKPQVLLLDEPFGALDAKIREELRWTIRRVQRELGITTVLVTHDQEEAFALADRIGVMNLGRLLEVGAPRDLYARPTTRFVATFLGAANLLLALQGAEGIRLGTTPVDATVRTPALTGREHEVVTVLRPEEVEMAAEREQLTTSYMGRATVEELQFTGALERLRLKLLDNQHAVQTTGNGAEGRIEATRLQSERRAMPLAVGAVVALGARRMHVLPTPLSSFSIHAADEAAAQLLAQAPLLETLAGRMKTRVATCADASDGAPNARPGVAVIEGSDGAALRAVQLLRAGANEVLLLSPSTTLPEQICMFWLDDAARHATMAVTASLLRHLPAEAVCVATAPAGRRDAKRANALRALLDARSEARAAHALETRTELVPGEGPQALGEYLAGLSAPLLVLGTADITTAEAALGALLARRPGMPVLVVYRESAR
ncbi:MAG: ABC transporter ATP-binding protein [Proteobacteria bacterium]|jgi:sulfate transport system ATP-binding protein|nr:ABC transporter ATP-binding protein [Pseudomonadota bacterium]MBK7116236.1 ABC transporter ATP-binding protein [Pseudomonadota bacterium]MBK9252342.1 ABC transporter ATP-binding protein [Pseudomonadota bacterium]MCC6633097.1 ABC transporter ATP-binding protein [Gammaproteobacteria bacterium]